MGIRGILSVSCNEVNSGSFGFFSKPRFGKITQLTIFIINHQRRNSETLKKQLAVNNPRYLFFPKSIFGLIITICSFSSLISCEEENQPPTCEIKLEDSKTEYFIGEKVPIEINSNDVDGEIEELRLYINDIGIKSNTTSDLEFLWDTKNEEEGIVNIKAIVKDNRDEMADAEIQVELIRAPEISTVSFYADHTIAKIGESIQFTDKSTNEPTAWKWDFGDGSESILQNPAHVFFEKGTYTISLEVKNEAGTFKVSKTEYIKIEELLYAPVAEFSASPLNALINEPIKFEDNSSNSPTIWSWDFGDGNTSTQTNPYHRYEEAGIYTVKLTVSNTEGTDTKVKYDYVTVQESPMSPTADFTVSSTTIKSGAQIQFYDHSTGDPESWLWEFGDGQSSTQQNPVHIFYERGLYTVELTVSNNIGQDSIVKTKHIIVSDNSVVQVTGSFTDSRDNHTYNTIKIGDQWWMAENLAYLPAVSPPEIGSETEPYYYIRGFYGTDVDAAKAYEFQGALYNLPAALTACPQGWHLPSDDEWKELEIFLGMDPGEADNTDYRGTDQGEMLKSTSGWAHYGNGTDDYGFTTVPAGMRVVANFSYGGSGSSLAAFWTSTAGTGPWSDYAYKRVFSSGSRISRSLYPGEFGYSVRCIKD